MADPHAMFLLSTGRCSTQFMAHTLKGRDENIVVEHEPIGANYNPRAVFRKPGKEMATLGKNLRLQRHLFFIEDQLADGKRYIETGWPTYGWVNYLRGRFKTKFECAHLIRNPYFTAASMLTHRYYAGRDGVRINKGLIFGTDNNVLYPQFADRYETLTPYEKCLLFWMEVTGHLAQSHEWPEFKGFFKFEDLFSDNPETLKALASALMGQPVSGLETKPYDQHSGTLPTEIVLNDSELKDELTKLATGLGYSEDELSAFDIDGLNETYSAKRVAKVR